MPSIEEAVALIESLAPQGRPVPFRVPLQPDEADWFVRSVAQGIVAFAECPADCPRAKRWGATGPDHFTTPSGDARHLFSKPGSDPAWLNREYVPHIAAYGRAILQLGYDQEASSFSRYRKYTRDLLTKRRGRDFETDAEFYDPAGGVHLQIEAKASRQQTDRLADQIRDRRDLAALPAGAAKEIEYVLDLRPRYLWVVGPGSIDPARHVFAVTVDGLTASFDPLGELPAPPR